MKLAHEFFNSGDLSTDRNDDLNARILKAIQHMDSKLGVGEQITRQSFEKELSRKTAVAALNRLAYEGVTIEGASVLDLGAGLGKLSVEAALRGAKPVAVEPGHGMGKIIFERLKSERDALSGSVVMAAGEQLPFRGGTFDVVVSLQVLEHVNNPYYVLQEAFRVLKPGGIFYLSCENYLSFWEPHYQVRWFPLMPKRVGSLYLRCRGLSPEFLNTSITYVTLPGVRRMLKQCGFISKTEQRVRSFIESPDLLKSTWKRLVITLGRRLMSVASLTRIALVFSQTARMFFPGIYEVLQKPHAEANIVSGR